MKNLIYRMSKNMMWKLINEGYDTKRKILDYLNLTAGIKGKIVDLEVF